MTTIYQGANPKIKQLNDLKTYLNENFVQPLLIRDMEFIQNKFGLDYKAFAAPFNDRNLKKPLIEYLLSENIIDVFFGTQGFRKDTTSKSRNSYQERREYERRSDASSAQSRQRTVYYCTKE